MQPEAKQSKANAHGLSKKVIMLKRLRLWLKWADKIIMKQCSEYD